jgi:hypothetical protein
MPLPVLALLATLLVAPGELSWQAVEECPGGPELETAIASWIGPSSGEREGVGARGRIQPTEAGYRLDLVVELGSREQSHVLFGHDCDELTGLAALLIASAIDPFVLGQAPTDAIVVAPERPRVELSRPIPERPSPEPPSPEPRSADPVEFGPLAAVEPAEPARRRPRVEGFLAASGMGYAGLFQRPSGGVELLGGIDRGALRVGIGAAGWFGGQFRSPTEGVGGDLQAVSGLLEVCGVPSVERARLGFPLCAVGTAGAIVGTGVGVPAPATVVRPWAAAGGDVGLRWRVHRRIALRLGVGLLASLIRPVWTVAGPVVTFTTPPVMGTVRVALELFLGPR